MRIIGLTGSIGMGKSTTMGLFAEQGAAVYDADAAVHRLYEGAAVVPIEAAFPGTTEGGKVNRERLAAKVLGDTEALKRLESVVHPLLQAERHAFLDEAERSGAAVAVLDVPLLFETGGETNVDAVVVVSAPEHLQRERVLARANMNPEKLEAILLRQMPDAQKRARADFVVDTSAGLAPVRERVKDILAEVATMPRRRA